MQALVFNMTLPQAAILKGLSLARKDLFFDGPLATVRLREVPEPGLPSPDWVKIRTVACGFCGSDLNLILLRESLTASPFSSFPCVMGHEMCGIVAETGAGVTNLAAGDFVTVAPHLDCATRGIEPVCRACAAGRVNNCENFARGGFAPGMFLGVCRDLPGAFAPVFCAHKSRVFKLPPGADPDAGALVEPFSVALATVLDNPPREGEKVLVVGGGVIGSLLVRAIRALGCGCDITVAEPSPFSAGTAKSSGADRVVSGDIIAAAPGISGGASYKPLFGKNILMGGFDRIYDSVGSSATLNACLRVLAAGGVLSLVGINESVKFDPTPLWLKNQTIKGTLAYGYRSVDGRPVHVYETAIDLLARGRVKLSDMATHRFRLSDYKEMIRVNLAKSAHKAVKTLVVFP